MSKPREWWILGEEDSDFEAAFYTKHPGPDYAGPDYAPIHVIEYSAYEKLKAENWVLKDSQLRTYDGLSEKAAKYDEALADRNRMEEHWREACKAGEELKAKLEICTEALERINNEGQSLYLNKEQLLQSKYDIARAALEKLK